MKRYVDRNRKEIVKSKVGDKILLSIKEIVNVNRVIRYEK